MTELERFFRRLVANLAGSDPARLHRASKLAPRVVVYLQKDPAQWVRTLAGERIHRAEALEIYAIDRALIGAIVARLERRMAFSLSINDRELYLAFNDTTLSGDVKGVTWG